MLNRVTTQGNATDHARRGAELVEAARSLAPTIAAATGRIEKEREIPADLIEAMHAACLFRMLIPASIGGEEVEPATFFHVMEAVAGADASLAWCLGQNSGVSMAAAYLDPKVAREMFGDARAAVATGAPSAGAKAIITDGGYRVTGHWKFASGSRHSQWLGGHATICGSGRMASRSSSAPCSSRSRRPRSPTPGR
jgi:indole-3-acetate monooxygenase